MGAGGSEHLIRQAAFEFLDRLNLVHGEELPRELLVKGFTFEGKRVPLMGPQGIFKPAVLSQIPLSITTVPPVEGKPRPYEDEFAGDNLILYRYRGTDPGHRENVGLRTAWKRQVPLVYFFGLAPGWYLAEKPAYIVGDDPARLAFYVQLDAAGLQIDGAQLVHEGGHEARRAYVTAQVQRRVHQRSFRRRVLAAYREVCAVCRLRHSELLDAAHIIPDSEPHGRAVVPNGLAMCKLHHAAFDQHFLGIRPDLEVELRHDLLREKDGPMLRHGLQGFQGQKIHVPHSTHLRPDPGLLEERYERFRKAM